MNPCPFQNPVAIFSHLSQACAWRGDVQGTNGVEMKQRGVRHLKLQIFPSISVDSGPDCLPQGLRCVSLSLSLSLSVQDTKYRVESASGGIFVPKWPGLGLKRIRYGPSVPEGERRGCMDAVAPHARMNVPFHVSFVLCAVGTQGWAPSWSECSRKAPGCARYVHGCLKAYRRRFQPTRARPASANPRE